MAKKKSKLEEMSVIDAVEHKFQPTTLDQIWGDTGISKYKTMDADEYQNILSGMSKTDIREHAISIGIAPIDNREILVARLMSEFKKHISMFTKPITQKQQFKIDDAAMKILKEGA